MRPRRKFHIVIPALALAAVGAAILYLRVLEYTVSVRSLIVEEIGRAVGKKAFARSVRFDPIKGLVLDGVAIYDEKRVVVRAREVSSGLLIPSLVSRKVIIPSIRIDSPRIRIERLPDGSLSLSELIPKGYVARSGAVISVHRIVVRDGRADFTDLSLDPPFGMKFVNLEAEVKLYLPVRVTFRSSFRVPAGTSIRLSGEYVIPTAALAAEIVSDNLAPKDFDRYYRASGMIFPSGELAVKAVLKAGPGVIDVHMGSATKGLTIVKDNVKARADFTLKARARYSFAEKKLTYSGAADIRSMEAENIAGLGKLEALKARVEFDQDRISATDVRVTALGMPWDAKVNLVNFARPMIDIYAHAGVHLGALQETLKSRFGVQFPTEVAGKGDIRLSLQTEPGKPARMNGSLTVSGATASLGSGNFPIENIAGELLFSPEGIRWRDMTCGYRGAAYRASGTITNFAAPRAHLEIASKDLSYTSEFEIKDKIINLSRLDGRYLASSFSAKGEISLEDPAAIDASLSGTLSLNLADLRRISPGPAGMRKMKPAGTVKAEFELAGDLKSLKTCYVNAKAKTKAMSAYGLKFTDVTLAFVQEQGLGSIKSMRSSFYGGTLSVTAHIDWMARGMPYSANLDAIGVKLEDLKADTDFRDKDVSGDIKVYADVKGVFKDVSRLTSIGHVGLAKGRLWQLNLFKGAGSLIFTSDFSDVVFTSGACDYKVRDNACFIDNLVMRSDLLTFYGSGRVGFDRSVEGTLRPEISPDVAAAGTLASAIGKGTVIEISGTLKDPAFRTRTSVIDVVGAMLQPE